MALTILRHLVCHGDEYTLEIYYWQIMDGVSEHTSSAPSHNTTTPSSEIEGHNIDSLNVHPLIEDDILIQGTIPVVCDAVCVCFV